MATKYSATRSAPSSTFENADETSWTRLGRAAGPMRAFTHLCRESTEAGLDVEATSFHSSVEPPVALARYVERIARHAECGELGVLLGLRLAGRYAAVRGVPLTVHIAHRLLLTAMLVGTKAHMDRFRSNRTFARVGGIEVAEMNLLEKAFMRALDYRVMVTKEDLTQMVAAANRAGAVGWGGAAAQESALIAQRAFIVVTQGLPNAAPPAVRASLPSPPVSMAMEVSPPASLRARSTHRSLLLLDATWSSQNDSSLAASATVSANQSPLRNEVSPGQTPATCALDGHSPAEAYVAGTALRAARAARLGGQRAAFEAGNLRGLAPLSSPTESDIGELSPTATLPHTNRGSQFWQPVV